MAKYECTIHDNFYKVLQTVERGVIDGSLTSNLEESSNFYHGNTRCAVRVFERYSALGGNRLSLNVTMVGNDEAVKVVAVTSGGSQAVLFKFNTFGEESFLDNFISMLYDSNLNISAGLS